VASGELSKGVSGSYNHRKAVARAHWQISVVSMAEALSRLIPNADCRLILVIRHRQELSFAKTRAGFKIKKIPWGQATCYMERILAGRSFADDKVFTTATHAIAKAFTEKYGSN
jgi:hypothetical protein